jgi:hypothetical protein
MQQGRARSGPLETLDAVRSGALGTGRDPRCGRIACTHVHKEAQSTSVVSAREPAGDESSSFVGACEYEEDESSSFVGACEYEEDESSSFVDACEYEDDESKSLTSAREHETDESRSPASARDPPWLHMYEQA